MNRVTGQHIAVPAAQRGAAVLMLLAIIALSTATYFLVRKLNNTNPQIERDRTNAAVLAQAKDGVLGYAVANQEMPGGLPFPDRNSESPPNYDGNADCVTAGFNNSHLLGRFPFLNEEGCGSAIRAFDIKPTDAGGEHLWYAVSGKLVKSAAGGNFSIPTNTSTLMTSGGWLSVVDERGTVLSNQVAFILFAPGAVLAGQNRAITAPHVRHYLDSFTIGSTTHRNSDANLNLSFITARPVNDGGNRFNDRLIYVNRDEFIDRLVWRITHEIRSRLDQYHATSGHYPFAAPATDGECVHNTTTAGYIPIQDAMADCGGTWPVFPGWWFVHEWQLVTHYTYTSPDHYSIQFDACASTFTTTWNATLNRGETQRSGPC